MIDNTTDRLNLPLPDIDNYLEDDVRRLAEALTTIGSAVTTQEEKQELAEQTQQASEAASNADRKAQHAIEGLEQLNSSVDGLGDQIEQFEPPSSSSFTYTDGVLTQMTEVLVGGDRVTSFNYSNGKLAQSVEVFGNRTRTTTYNYDPSGVLTGLTKQDVFA